MHFYSLRQDKTAQSRRGVRLCSSLSQVFAMAKAVNEAKGRNYQYHCRKYRNTYKAMNEREGVRQKSGYEC